MLCDKLALQQSHQLGDGGGVHHQQRPLSLFVQPPLGVLAVVVGGGRRQHLPGLLVVVLRGLLQHGRLELLAVDGRVGDAQLDHHGQHAADQADVHGLALPVLADGLEQKALDARPQVGVLRHDRTEDDNALLENGELPVVAGVAAVEVHEDVLDQPEVEDAPLVDLPQGAQEQRLVRVRLRRYLGAALLVQVGGYRLADPVVEEVAVLVQHELVGRAVELFERQVRRRATVDVANGLGDL